MGQKCRKYARARKNRLIKPKDQSQDQQEKNQKAFDGKCSRRQSEKSR